MRVPAADRRGGAGLRPLARSLNRALSSVLGVSIVRTDAVGVRIDEEWVARFLYFARLVDRIRDVRGDIVECGVAGGASLAMLASLVRARGPRRRVWGFDSWAGLPAPSAADLSSARSAAAEGLFAWGSPDTVRRELQGHGFAADELDSIVTLVRGKFAETLPQASAEIALLHIDADLHESYRLALQHLWPRVVVGGIAAFDEYELEEFWPGARKAIDEFVSAQPADTCSLQRDEESGKWHLVRVGTS